MGAELADPAVEPELGDQGLIIRGLAAARLAVLAVLASLRRAPLVTARGKDVVGAGEPGQREIGLARLGAVGRPAGHPGPGW